MAQAAAESVNAAECKKQELGEEERRLNGASEPAGAKELARSNGLCMRCSAFLARVPSYFWIALCCMLVLEAVAVVGSVYYARSVQNSSTGSACSVAQTSARDLEKLLDSQKAPILSLANLVTLNPHWPTVNASFLNFSQAIYENYPFYEIEACPYGVVGAMSFPWLNLTGSDLYEFKVDFDYEVDLFTPGRWDWDNNVNTILHNRSIVIAGPWYGEGALASGAFVLRYSIFLPNATSESWDMPPNHMDSVPSSITYDAEDGTRFWGWANSVFVWPAINQGLAAVQDAGLLYSLAPGANSGNPPGFLLASSQTAPSNSTQQCVPVNVYDAWSWTLCVDDPSGRAWWPAWFPGLIVGVTALAFLISAMVCLVLRSKAQAVALLTQQVQTNRELAVAKEEAEAAREEAEAAREEAEAEKARMESLVQRQFQLIQLFEKDSGHGQGLNSETGSVSSAVARDRIEQMRLQLNRGSGAGRPGQMPTADICLMELLGEGSFGKVYRGMWRGTEVAIKTMVLPPYMSGKEKREKMFIMETAISSALAHPNIVQTFTYSIDSIQENRHPTAFMDCLIVEGLGCTQQGYGFSARPPGAKAPVVPPAPPSPEPDSPSVESHWESHGGTQNGEEASALVSAGDSLKSPAKPGPGQGQGQGQGHGNGSLSMTSRAGSGAVHGFEVRLVLEFCDKGCLYDALTNHAFLTPAGLNYRGILDTALDVTRAMVHLHMAGVIHGDLKARNVMLKSSGTEGRGLVGKVADFGLAVRMENQQQTHMSNLFQGTLTHMAPELLLQGRMSPASDVVRVWNPAGGGGAQAASVATKPPEDFEKLVNDCWSHDPLCRPTFTDILQRLQAMRAALPGPTEPLAKYQVARILNPHQQDQERVHKVVAEGGAAAAVNKGASGDALSYGSWRSPMYASAGLSGAGLVLGASRLLPLREEDGEGEQVSREVTGVSPLMSGDTPAGTGEGRGRSAPAATATGRTLESGAVGPLDSKGGEEGVGVGQQPQARPNGIAAYHPPSPVTPVLVLVDEV